MADKTTPAKKSSSTSRLVFWVVVIALAAVTGWQAYAKFSFDAAHKRVTEAMKEREEKNQDGIKLADVDAACKAASRIGPIDDKEKRLVVYCFNGPIRSYYLQIQITKDDTVVDKETSATLPELATKK